jgi:hypothetical protein
MKIGIDFTECESPTFGCVKKGLEMRGCRFGVWNVAGRVLRSIGRRTVWLIRRKIESEESCRVYAMVGGAVTCALFGTLAAVALASPARSTAFSVEAGLMGGLLGACVGIPFGAFVGIVDRLIRNFLASLDSY